MRGSKFHLFLSLCMPFSKETSALAKISAEGKSGSTPIGYGLLDDGKQPPQLVPIENESYAIHWMRPYQPVTHVKAVILTIGMFALLGFNLLQNSTKDSWIAFCVVVGLYLLEAACCSTRRYLSNIYTPAELLEYVEALRSKPPNIRWTVECYHHESDFGSRREGRGRQGSSSRKVVTHRASESFSYNK